MTEDNDLPMIKKADMDFLTAYFCELDELEDRIAVMCNSLGRVEAWFRQADDGWSIPITNDQAVALMIERRAAVVALIGQLGYGVHDD